MRAKSLVRPILFFSLASLLIFFAVAVSGDSADIDKYSGIKQALSEEEIKNFKYDDLIRKESDPSIEKHINELFNASKNVVDKQRDNLIDFFNKQGTELSKEQMMNLLYPDWKGDCAGCDKTDTEFYAFVSFSLPKDFIKQLIEESYELRKNGVKVSIVIRGFLKDSLKETAKAIFEITDGDPDKALFDMNPELFREFEIETVPVFVLKNKNKTVKLVGAVGLKYAYEKLQDETEELIIGNTYRIVEKDFYRLVQEKQKLIEQKVMESVKKIARENFKVKNDFSLKPALADRTFYIDPSYTVPEDIKDPTTGKVIYPKGTKVNPTKYAPLGRLIVINGNRPKEVELAIKGVFDLIIVSEGDLISLMTKHKHRMYSLSAAPEIVDKFKIRSTPSIIETEGDKVKITEVAVK